MMMMRFIGFSLLLFVLATSRAAASVDIPCAGDAIGREPAALAAADASFRGNWLDRSPNWYTAYEAKPPKRSVFDAARDAGKTADVIKGTAWAHGLFCMGNVSPDGNEVLVRYYARVVGFFEENRWQLATDDEGLLQSFLVKRKADGWTVETIAGDRSVLLPGATLRAPGVDALPAPDLKAGIPCQSGAAWDGNACVMVSVPASGIAKKR